MKKNTSKISVFLITIAMICSMFGGILFAAGEETTIIDLSSMSTKVSFTYDAHPEDAVAAAKTVYNKLGLKLTDAEVLSILNASAVNGRLPASAEGTMKYDPAKKELVFNGSMTVTFANNQKKGTPNLSVTYKKTRTLPVNDIEMVLSIDGKEQTATYDDATGRITTSYVIPADRHDVTIYIKKFVAKTTYDNEPGKVNFVSNGKSSAASFEVNGVIRYTLDNPTFDDIKAKTTVNGTPMNLTADATFNGTGITIKYGFNTNVCSKVNIKITNPTSGLGFSSSATVSGTGVEKTATVSWDASGIADYNKAYTATIVVNAAKGYTFDDSTVFCINGVEYPSIHLNGKYSQHIITYKAPATAPMESGVGGFVERLYTVALNRPSDPNGKQSWIDLIYYDNYTGSMVALGFLYSDEFLNKGLSNSDFVDVLYKTFFNRPADEAGKQMWISALESGTSKKDIILGFINSVEWANTCLEYGIPSGSLAEANITVEPNEKILDFVTRLYNKCLDREPDAVGFQTWTYGLANRKMTGTDCAYGFFFSPEFINKNLSNKEYVDYLYTTVLGRTADENSAQWVALLDNGTMSREDVFYGFAESREFTKICTDYRIVR